MENIAHSLVGLLTAKAGLERLSPGATSACVIAANLPDGDVLAGVYGRWFLLEHHRGITHSILGVLVLPILLTATYKLADLLYARIRSKIAKVRFWPLLLASAIACATHPILDWTNNYGIRPFLPWSGKWVYGDLVFIVDPWIWLIAGGCVFIATSYSRWRLAAWTVAWCAFFAAFALYAHRAAMPDSGWLLGIWLAGLSIFVAARITLPINKFGQWAASAGLVLIVVYWVGLGLMHHRALDQASSVALKISGNSNEPILRKISENSNEQILRIVATPTFADPRDWLCIFETTSATYRFPMKLGEQHGTVDWTRFVRYPKPAGKEAEFVKAATVDPRVKIFLGFARFPVEGVLDDCLTQTLVEFADLRYTQPGEESQGNFGLTVDVSCDDIR